MTVVSNTSPMMNLARVGHLQLLQQLYQKIIIPEAVCHELRAIFSTELRFEDFPWIETRTVRNRSLVDALQIELHKGEAEAIAIAIDERADLLLMDERIGRRVAQRLGLRFVGLLGILVEAKQEQLITEVKPILDDLVVRAGFWIAPSLYDRVLDEVGE